VRVSRPLMALLLAITTLVVPAVLATNQAQAYACRSTDRFTGHVAAMEHFLNCNHIRFDVYTVKEPNPTVAPMATTTPTTTTALSGPGGPSCEWLAKHVLKKCYQRGIAHLICAQYWSGYYYPYHCGPVQAYNITHAQSLWSVVKHIFKNHAIQACTRGMVGGSATAVILKTAGASTGIGIVATVGGGCVGGLATFFWHI
jgi:hypothetical protein